MYYPTYVVKGNQKLYLESFNKAIKGESVVAQNQTEGEDFSIWFEYKVLPVYDEDGNLFAVSLSAKNIDKEKKAELEIKRLNESLEIKVKERTKELLEINCNLDAFNYSISHDLQQPLVGIKLVLESIQRKYKEELGNELQTVINSTNEMSSLIKGLLNLSKISKKELSKKNVKMHNLVKQVCEDLKLSNRENAFEIIINNIPDAYCDPLLVKQVWTNLISNAIKYSRGSEKPIIEISSKNINNKTIYLVKDNGVGFKMEYAKKMFVLFGRLHKNKGYEGSGIGLTIVHRIINRHGGRIWAEAQENKEATFYFALTA